MRWRHSSGRTRPVVPSFGVICNLAASRLVSRACPREPADGRFFHLKVAGSRRPGRVWKKSPDEKISGRPKNNVNKNKRSEADKKGRKRGPKRPARRQPVEAAQPGRRSSGGSSGPRPPPPPPPATPTQSTSNLISFSSGSSRVRRLRSPHPFQSGPRAPVAVTNAGHSVFLLEAGQALFCSLKTLAHVLEICFSFPFLPAGPSGLAERVSSTCPRRAAQKRSH